MTFDDYACKVISPSVVLDHRLDGEDLAWVRDHLRRCEVCRKRIDRERLRRERRLEAATSTSPRRQLVPVLALPRNRQREISAWVRENSRRLALVASITALVGGFFLASSLRLAGDAGKQTPTVAGRFAAGSVDAAKPPIEPSAFPASVPSTSPATSHDRTEPAAVVPSLRPTPAPTLRVAPVAPVPPTVILRLTVTSPCCLAPLTVRADAAGSASAVGIASYQFYFDDGVGPIPPMRDATWVSYTFCRAGPHKVTVVVTDKLGLSSRAVATIDVIAPVNPIC